MCTRAKEYHSHKIRTLMPAELSFISIVMPCQDEEQVTMMRKRAEPGGGIGDRHTDTPSKGTFNQSTFVSGREQEVGKLIAFTFLVV